MEARCNNHLMKQHLQLCSSWAAVTSLTSAGCPQVPIVVTAEDGVTSQRYYVVVTRAVAAATTAGSALGSLEELWAAALAPGGDIGLLGDLGPSVPGPAGGFAAAPSSGPGSAVLSGLAPSSEQVRSTTQRRVWAT